ncbi:MAG: ABC transporter ATP-binding protein [Candidatus Peribacteraceae bacterium]|nr:ABC transporter ATP-binding protein [Candidatus Peribacteraceae bacterium]
MTAQPIISVRKLCVTYFPGKSNEVRALKDVSLDINPGEFIIFFGPSGCGKSTLLYSISGLEKKITGDILVKGENLPTMTPRQRETFHQRTIGMVFQAYYLIASLSVLDNVTLPQVALNEPAHVRNAKALELLKKFGVFEQAKKLPTELSGGQQQRVAICRSIMNDPDILFADEPVGNLDSKSSEEVMELLRELNERDHKTVILVTHDPSHLHHAHRVFFMRDGQIIRVQQNTAEDRKQSPVVAAAKETQSGLQQWAKTLTPEDLKRAAEMAAHMTHDDIQDLLRPLTPEQRSLVKDFVHDLLAGLHPPTSDEEMERLARGIIRLLSSDGHAKTIRTRTRTWRRGADILLFESRTPSALPTLTLAARVRLHPFFLRLRWMILLRFGSIFSRISAMLHRSTQGVSAACGRAFHAIRSALVALAHWACRLPPRVLRPLWRRITITAAATYRRARQAVLPACAAARRAWKAFLTALDALTRVFRKAVAAAARTLARAVAALKSAARKAVASTAAAFLRAASQAAAVWQVFARKARAAAATLRITSLLVLRNAMRLLRHSAERIRSLGLLFVGTIHALLPIVRSFFLLVLQRTTLLVRRGAGYLRFFCLRALHAIHARLQRCLALQQAAFRATAGFLRRLPPAIRTITASLGRACQAARRTLSAFLRRVGGSLMQLLLHLWRGISVATSSARDRACRMSRTARAALPRAFSASPPPNQPFSAQTTSTSRADSVREPPGPASAPLPSPPPDPRRVASLLSAIRARVSRLLAALRAWRAQRSRKNTLP